MSVEENEEVETYVSDQPNGPEYVEIDEDPGVKLPGEDEEKPSKKEVEKATKEPEAEEKPEVSSDKDPSLEGELEAYKLDDSYKVYDEIKTMPDWAKGLIQDKETEDNMRTVLQQADAFPVLKERHENLRNEKAEVEENLTKLSSAVNELDYYLQNDLQTFFERVKIPEDRLINHVKQLISIKENPAQREAYERSRQLLADQYESEQQSQTLAQQNQQLLKNQHEFAYQQAMSEPEVSHFQRLFDERMGSGAFRRQADIYGSAMYNQTGVNISPKEAVDYVVNSFKGMFDSGSDQTDDTSSNITERKQERGVGKPQGHIPNVGRGQTVSPTKRRAKTLDELRKRIDSELQQA